MFPKTKNPLSNLYCLSATLQKSRSFGASLNFISSAPFSSISRPNRNFKLQHIHSSKSIKPITSFYQFSSNRLPGISCLNLMDSPRKIGNSSEELESSSYSKDSYLSIDIPDTDSYPQKEISNKNNIHSILLSLKPQAIDPTGSKTSGELVPLLAGFNVPRNDFIFSSSLSDQTRSYSKSSRTSENDQQASMNPSENARDSIALNSETDTNLSNTATKTSEPSNYTTNATKVALIEDPNASSKAKTKLGEEKRNVFSSSEEKSMMSGHTTMGAWKKLILFAKNEYKLLGGAVCLLFVSSTVSMSVPFFFGKLIDMVTTPDFPLPYGLTTNQIFGGLASFFAIGALANFGRVYMIRKASESMIARLRTKIYSSIIREDMTFFEINRSGDLVSRLTVDTTIVSKSITNNVSDGLRSALSVVAGLSMMIYMSPKLSIIMLLVIPPIAGYAVFYGKFVKKITQRTQQALGDITKEAEERINNIRTVQAFGREDEETLSFGKASNYVYDLGKKEALISGIFFGSNGLIGNLSMLLFLGFGGKMVMANEITIGDLSSFMLYTAYVGSSLAGLSSFFSESMKGIGASMRLFYILERTPKITCDSSTEGIKLSEYKGHIQFENVCFKYPSRPDTTIFNNLNIDIMPGTHVAIAGPSGKGKSTLALLILRFYDINSGVIKIDGVDLKSLNLKQWRSNVAIVPQEPALFATTIKANLLYANPNASDHELEVALKRANAYSFVSKFPNGIDTFVGERGVSLSGGQKQRIAIARALLADPAVLILDEATSALDHQSEQSVQQALDRLTGSDEYDDDELNGDDRNSDTVLVNGEDSVSVTPLHVPSANLSTKRRASRTIITIAHRPSTLQKSDIVLVLGDNGNIVESGNYYELLANDDGYFKKLLSSKNDFQTAS
ncbi:ATP-dependent permease MDL1, mitochondrial [Smittium mucronatum]|uniref:ATP-dependent permease MDL1, mitochondrial n=1 Tax=Smittium mucronatum TaxID=133383 RepID=A0A1R0H751_9FUNG|nr:ATP-dependent permease MDL1, mitochondrial [Smittium mucronatum]